MSRIFITGPSDGMGVMAGMRGPVRRHPARLNGVAARGGLT